MSMSESKTPRHDALRIQATERPLEFKQLEVWAALAEAENDLAAAQSESHRAIAQLDDALGRLQQAKARIAELEAERERLAKDAERWQFVCGKVSRIYNEETMMMDGLRVEAYYDEPQPFLLTDVDKAALFNAAIDFALAAKEKNDA